METILSSQLSCPSSSSLPLAPLGGFSSRNSADGQISLLKITVVYFLMGSGVTGGVKGGFLCPPATLV